MRYYVTFSTGTEIPVDITELPSGQMRVLAAGTELAAELVEHARSVQVCIGGRVVDVWLDGAAPDVGVTAGSQRFRVKVESERMRASQSGRASAAGGGDWTVKSPMPGRVLKVLVAEGDSITAGMPLVVVEAMKMENELSCRQSGTVKKIYVSPGMNVEGGAKLIEIGHA